MRRYSSSKPWALRSRARFRPWLKMGCTIPPTSVPNMALGENRSLIVVLVSPPLALMWNSGCPFFTSPLVHVNSLHETVHLGPDLHVLLAPDGGREIVVEHHGARLRLHHGVGQDFRRAAVFATASHRKPPLGPAGAPTQRRGAPN